MKKLFAVLTTVGAALAITVPSATAHESSPNLLTTLTAVRPETPGLKVQVVELGDQLKVVNKTGKRVDLPGYSGEPYLRFLPDGTVQENQNSPAKYLNADRFGKTDVPASADENAEPVWKDVGKGGEYVFHDHRIHYMGTGTPPQVKDESVRTPVFDWKVPMTVGGKPVAATGTLTWVPSPDEGGGVGAGQIVIAALAVLLAALLALFLIRRRIRPATPGAPPPDDAPREAEDKDDEPVKEAW